MALASATNTTLEAIALNLRECHDVVICGHTSPDGDSLGSALALASVLQSLGIKATCVLAQDEPIPEIYEFLPGAKDIIAAAAFDGPMDSFVAVDVSVKDRLGDGAILFDRAPKSFVIDHHECETAISPMAYVDPDAPSASCLIWELALELAPTPPKDCALCAYCGLATDTGGFRFQNATVRAFKSAASMVVYGANPALVATEVFQNRTLASLKLEEVLLGTMEIMADGQGALGTVSLGDIEAAGAIKSDTEPLIDVLRSVTGVRVACLLREQPDRIRGSLRAKDGTDVGALARTLNGGGHKASAGFTLYMSLDEARTFMEAKLEELLNSSLKA